MVYLLSQLISGRLGMSDAVIYILSSLVVIFLTLPVHEFAHGLAAVRELVKEAGGTEAAACAFLAEGDAADRKDIIFLEKLPLFFKD